MRRTLRLEYACTSAEMEEAQELNTRQQIGGGSKWRTTVILYLMMTGLLAALYFKFRREIPRAYQPYAFGGVFLLWLGLMIWQRRSRKHPPSASRVEVSESELAVLDGESRVTMPWSAFSQCLESPRLFVLVDRPKGTLIILPKRAFPDEGSQSRLRSVAGNRQSPAPATTSTSSTGETAPTAGIVVKFRLSFRDYLDRTVASWRTWGVFLAIVGLIGGITIYSAFNPPPHAVYSPAEVFFLFVLPTLLGCSLS